MKRVFLALLAMATALAISPVASAQNYDFTYSDVSAGVYASGIIDVSGTTAVSGTITFDGVNYALYPGSATAPNYVVSPSGAYYYDNQVYPSAGPNGYLSTTGGLVFINSGDTEEINIFAGPCCAQLGYSQNGPGPYDLWVWTPTGGYDPTSDTGTFTLTAVPEYGSLSMLILSVLTLAGGFYFKARQQPGITLTC